MVFTGCSLEVNFETLEPSQIGEGPSGPTAPTVEPLYCESHSGDLDTSFAEEGYFQLDLAGVNNVHYYSTGLIDMDSQGRIYALGVTHNGTHREPTLLRLTEEGHLDASFGTLGVKSINLGADSGGSGLVIKNDKVHISSVGGGVRRLLQTDLDGELLNTFGTNGVAVNSNETSQDGIFVSTSGQVYLTGHRNSGGNNLTATRFNSNGSIDTGFGINGYLVSQTGPNEFGAGFALSRTEDKFYMISEVWSPGFDFSISRYHLDGSLDTTFNSTGSRAIDYNATANRGRGAVFDSADNIYMYGGVDSGPALIHKLFNDGTTDTSFGTNGWQDYAIGTVTSPKKIILQDGFLYAVFEAMLSGKKQLVIAKILTNGSLDASFNEGLGYKAFPWPENQASGVVSAVVDSKGRLVVYLEVNNGANTDIGILRFCM